MTVGADTSLTNILKADKGYHVRDRLSLNRTNGNLLNVIVKLLRTEAVEERVKLCFVLGESDPMT